jgi:hypothetical protein
MNLIPGVKQCKLYSLRDLNGGRLLSGADHLRSGTAGIEQSGEDGQSRHQREHSDNISGLEK